MPEYRGCAAWSRERGEPLIGTASTTRRWLLLEQPGPWGHDALTQSALPAGLVDRVRELARPLGLRPVLLRRPGHHPRDDHRRAVFLADVGPGAAVLRRTVVEDLDEVPDLLHAAAETGIDGVGEEHPGPLVLVCTHARHDACCAVEGRPAALAFADAHDDVWECSHIGGDRFAANVLVLPDGVYLGRVGPTDVPTVAAAVRDGRVSLPHYRGRSTLPFAVQAAEAMLRRELDLDRLDAVEVVDHHQLPDGDLRVRVRADGDPWVVQVAVGRTAGAHQLSCGATRLGHPPTYRLVACRPETA